MSTQKQREPGVCVSDLATRDERDAIEDMPTLIIESRPIRPVGCHGDSPVAGKTEVGSQPAVSRHRGTGMSA